MLNWCSECFSKQERESINFFKLKLEKFKYSHAAYLKQCQNNDILIFSFLVCLMKIGWEFGNLKDSLFFN